MRGFAEGRIGHNAIDARNNQPLCTLESIQCSAEY